MKKILLILFVSSLTTTTKSQTFVDTTKIWSVVECLNFGGCGTTYFQFGGDTLIGIYQYKKFCCYPIFINGMMREDSTGKVYLHNFVSEYLLYDFSLNKNDTFSTSINGFNLQMSVDSVDSVILLNGEMRKRLLFANNADVWIEGIGSLYGPTNIGWSLYAFDLYETLNCFSENNILKYKNFSFDSCYFSSVGIGEVHTDNSFTITPNPSHGEFNLNFNFGKESSAIVEVHDMKGVAVTEPKKIFRKNSSYVLDLKNVSAGIYFVTVTWGERKIHAKLIIE